MSRHTNDTVFGFLEVSKKLRVDMREVEKLVKKKELILVVSAIRKTRAITRESFYAYGKRKGLNNGN